ncbi:MAG: hypothetical protein V1702_03755 [Candidatus Woesearchaeota archaeon]
MLPYVYADLRSSRRRNTTEVLNLTPLHTLVFDLLYSAWLKGGKAVFEEDVAMHLPEQIRDSDVTLKAIRETFKEAERAGRVKRLANGGFILTKR